MSTPQEREVRLFGGSRLSWTARRKLRNVAVLIHYPQLHSPQEREVLLAQNKKEGQCGVEPSSHLMSWAVKNYYTSKTLRFPKTHVKIFPHLKELEETGQPFCLSLNMGQHIPLWIQQQWPLSCERGEHQ